VIYIGWYTCFAFGRREEPDRRTFVHLTCGIMLIVSEL